MIYLSVTHIDAVTGIVCTEQPMRTGPAYPKIKNLTVVWANEAVWPVATTPSGVYMTAPLFFGTCDDDADLSVPGVVSTYTAEEYQLLKTAEHQARQRFPSWIGSVETMTWEPPTPYPNNGKPYYWDEEQLNWLELT